jgi:glycosyltransferase involved in cell wall biosynthesis
MKNIGILAFLADDKESTPLSNLIELIHPLSNELHVVVGNDNIIASYPDHVQIHRFKHNPQKNVVNRALNYAYTQIKISYKIIRINNIDTWIFFIGGDTLVLPMLAAKLLRTKVILIFAGSAIKTLQSFNDGLYKVAKFLSRINCELSDKIVVYSESLINYLELEHYKNKINIALHSFINFDKFRIINSYDKRDNLIGYIGRLSNEKGVMNFVEAIPEINNVNDEIKFLIIGDGDLKDEILKYVDSHDLNSTVTIIDWITHNKIPEYFNELKLLVLPSYTEGLPNVMLESMACGTPVLAMPVGAVPDIIHDKKTGFLLKENSPKCISEGVINVLEQNNLQEVIDKSHSLVEKKFFYNNLSNGWKDLLNSLDEK